jgi:hypothetical protein
MRKGKYVVIPNIGIMIGGYIMFRCIEALCRNDNQFSSEAGRKTVVISAVLGILVTGILTLNLIFSGNSLNSLGSAIAPLVEGPAGRPETCRDPHERLGSMGVCVCDPGYERDVTTLKCR